MNDLFDKDITIINKYFDKSEKRNKYKVSYIKGFWSSNDGISVSGTQLTKTDSLAVRILMSHEKYQKPKEFEKNPIGWTLQNDDYLVKGIVSNFTSIQDLLEKYDEVMKITNIAPKDYGSKDMWHWAIVGV